MENRYQYVLGKFQTLSQSDQIMLVNSIGIDNAVLLLNKSFDELSEDKKAEIVSKIPPELFVRVMSLFPNLA